MAAALACPWCERRGAEGKWDWGCAGKAEGWCASALCHPSGEGGAGLGRGGNGAARGDERSGAKGRVFHTGGEATEATIGGGELVE